MTYGSPLGAGGERLFVPLPSRQPYEKHSVTKGSSNIGTTSIVQAWSPWSPRGFRSVTSVAHDLGSIWA